MTADPRQPVAQCPRVVLLILTWNRRDDVLRCAASLPRLRYPSFTPVVIDNASTDGSVEALCERHPQLTVLRNPRNLGYAAGNNVGIRWALEKGADYVLIVNSDTEMTADLISELVRVAESDERIGVVGARNLLMEDPSRLWAAYARLTYGPFVARTVGAGAPDGPHWRVTRDVDSVIGNGYLWRRTALEQVGLLDESYFGYHEDLDWCVRARRAGFRVVYAGSAAIIHRGGSSSDPTQARAFPLGYFLGRNGVLFARRYGSFRDRVRFAFCCGAAWLARLARARLLAALPLGTQTRARGRTLLAQERAFRRGVLDALRRRPVPFAELGLPDACATVTGEPALPKNSPANP
jgi:GT2 family glycosyltransferase